VAVTAVFDTNILFSATGCAIEGQAQYVVSGDKDLLVLKEFRGIQIVRASDFLKVLADAKR
jgi:predicted nucleic acid-binding protein